MQTTDLSKHRYNLERVVITGVMLALATALSLITLWKMPMGGTVTLFSMAPVIFIALRYGVRWGLVSAFLYSLIQLALGAAELMSLGLTATVLFGSFVFDYLLAFSVLGLAGIFKNKSFRAQMAGIAAVMALRFTFHVISGMIFFGSWAWEGWNPLLYSIAYNGAFMLPELIMTLLVLGGTRVVSQLAGKKMI